LEQPVQISLKNTSRKIIAVKGNAHPEFNTQCENEKQTTKNYFNRTKSSGTVNKTRSISFGLKYTTR
jgi:hypothetical protein